MQIWELGLRPCLLERGSFPTIDARLDLQMMDKIEQEIELKKNINGRKKRLAGILKKFNAA